MKPSEVLKQLNALKEDYRRQLFVYTPEQQKEYDRLIELRRERVKYFHQNGLVSKGGAKPKNAALYARVKAEAKRKFDVYPSAYANAWLVRTYKKRGGGYRSA